MPIVGYSAALEQFHPTDLLRWCQEAEQAGFGGTMVADHFHPWVPQQGHSSFAWSWMGAWSGDLKAHLWARRHQRLLPLPSSDHCAGIRHPCRHVPWPFLVRFGDR